MDIVLHVKKWIDRQRLILPQSRILTAVSGGPDSVALLVILGRLSREMPFSLFAAHYDHGIRAAAVREKRLVEKLAASAGVPLVIGSGDVPAEAKKRRNGIEETARLLRYAFLEDAARQFSADAVALGHTREDQAETILHHIIRGAGWRGISGMPARRGIFIRPLLTCSRVDLAAMLRRSGIRYAVDKSNLDNTYLRNRIRNRLLPYLKRGFNPSIEEGLLRLGDNLAEGWQALEESVKHLIPPADDGGSVHVPVSAFENLSDFQLYLTVDCILRERLGLYRDIEKSHYDAVKRLIRRGRSGGRVQLPHGVTLLKDQLAVHVTRHGEKRGRIPDEILLPGPGRYELESWGYAVEIETVASPGAVAGTANEVYAASILFPIRIRARTSGDRMVPFGMRGRKKLSDLFIDRKIPVHSRNRVPVFEDANGIFWVPGVAADERTRITHGKCTVTRIRISTVTS